MLGRRALGLVFCLSLCAAASAELVLPSDIDVEATGPGGAIVTYTVSVLGGGDGGDGRDTVTVACTPPSLSLFPIGTTTVSCDGSDGSSGSFLVTVSDNTPPVLTLPASFAVVTAATSEIVTFDATATDLVDGSVAVSCVPPSGSSFSLGTTSVACSASDSRGNTSSGSFSITVANEPPPPPPNPLDITKEATGPDGALVTFNLGAEDDDGRGGSTCSPLSGTVFPLGVTEVVCATTSFNVTVVDTTPPALSLPGTVTEVSSVPVAVTFSVTATDLVDGSVGVTCTPPSGSTFSLGTTSVSCSASDSRGNSASGSFNVEVVEAPPPPTNPTDIVAEATSSAGAVVTFDFGFDDGGRPITCSPSSGSTFPLGATSVTCSDATTFTVTVVDTTAPTLTLPADITTEATGPTGAVVSFTATASDIVDGSVGVTCAPPSGSTFALGATTVSCSASDAAGNSASGSFTVTVVDTTPPVLTLPADITEEATGPSGAVVTFTATASDIVDGSVGVTCTPPSGSTFALGSTTVSCSASDAAGNSASGSFTVTVVDTTPPTIVSITPSPSSIWPPNHKLVEVTVTVDAFDIVDPAPVVQIYAVTCNEPIDPSDAVITGPLTVQLRAERDAHGTGRVYTIHIEVIDASGNRSTGTTTVTVPHDQGKSRAAHS